MANKIMKTLTIGENIYEIVDESARTELSQLSATVNDLKGSQTSGISAELTGALVNYFTHVLPNFDVSNGMSLINAVLTALGAETRGESGGEPSTPVTLSSISATYNGGSVLVGTSVNTLTGIVVTARYSDGTTATVTGYTLSGTIVEGSNTVTISYGGKTTTITVIGYVENEPVVTLSSISATYNGGNVVVGTSVNDLTGITVKAHYSDGTSKTVTDYTLSGTIVEGNNTITISYGGKTTTFTVVGYVEQEEPDTPPETSDAVYRLAQETTFDGTSGIDTGYILLDKDKSWSVCVDFTGNSHTVWDASPTGSKGMALSHRGNWFRCLYAIDYVDISGGNTGNHNVVVTHTEGENSVQYHYIYDGESYKQGTLDITRDNGYANSNIIADSPRTVKVGSDYNGGDVFVGTIHKFEIYERVLTTDEINAFMGGV